MIRDKKITLFYMSIFCFGTFILLYSSTYAIFELISVIINLRINIFVQIIFSTISFILSLGATGTILLIYSFNLKKHEKDTWYLLYGLSYVIFGYGVIIGILYNKWFQTLGLIFFIFSSTVSIMINAYITHKENGVSLQYYSKMIDKNFFQNIERIDKWKNKRKKLKEKYICSHHYQFYKTETKTYFWKFKRKRSIYKCSECGNTENGLWGKPSIFKN